MSEIYLILDLYGEVIARYQAVSEYDAGMMYERDVKTQEEPCEPYQVMTRREWVAWKT